MKNKTWDFIKCFIKQAQITRLIYLSRIDLKLPVTFESLAGAWVRPIRIPKIVIPRRGIFKTAGV